MVYIENKWKTNHENCFRQVGYRRFRSTKFCKVQKQKAQAERQTIGYATCFPR
jgi:hypothetical protein